MRAVRHSLGAGTAEAAVSDGAAAMTTPAVGARARRGCSREAGGAEAGAAAERGILPAPAPPPRRGGRAVCAPRAPRACAAGRSAGRAGHDRRPGCGEDARHPPLRRDRWTWPRLRVPAVELLPPWRSRSGDSGWFSYICTYV